MSNYKWSNTIIGPHHPDVAQWNYQEWKLKNYAPFIVQPKQNVELYELWEGCRWGKGDRYPEKNYKCLAQFTSLDAAKVAYIMRIKS